MEVFNINRKKDGITCYKDHYMYIEKHNEDYFKRLYIKNAENYENSNPFHFIHNIFVFFWVLILGGMPERYWIFREILFYSFGNGVSRFQSDIYDILRNFENTRWRIEHLKINIKNEVSKEEKIAREESNKLQDLLETEKNNIKRWKQIGLTNEEIVERLDGSLGIDNCEKMSVIIHKKTENYEFEIHDEFHGKYYIEIFLPDKIMGYYEEQNSLDFLVNKYSNLAIKLMDGYNKKNSKHIIYEAKNIETKNIDFLVRCNRLRNITAEDLFKK